VDLGDVHLCGEVLGMAVALLPVMETFYILGHFIKNVCLCGL
jgi:hypothetical protein